MAILEKCGVCWNGVAACSIDPFDHRRHPRANENGRAAPVGPQVEREGPRRGWKPVCLVFLGRGLRSGEQRERTVCIATQRLVLRAQREALQLVRMKQMMLVVERQRPETFHGRLLTLGERDL